MNNLQQEIIKKAFREKFTQEMALGRIWTHREITPAIIAEVEQFILEALEAVRLSTEKGVAEDICILIDIIESHSKTNTLEEWKQYKNIRNAIRDKYVLKEEKK